jgi:hypothetical protein
MPNTQPESFPLTALRLRFNCQAGAYLNLGGMRAGSNLRGALVQVMRRAACDHNPQSFSGRKVEVDPSHAAHCPVCWLVAANDHPGEERRGYVITPPVGLPDNLKPGGDFAFHITLFGEAARYLPYFVLAVPEAGRSGVGVGRGTFLMKSIHAEYPSAMEREVLREGENLVRPPNEVINHTLIEKATKDLTACLDVGSRRLQINFLTPLRLILDDHLVKAPDFGVIFANILKRIDDLSIQFAGGGERSPQERQRLWNMANQARLVESQAGWLDVASGSSRSGQRTWISGLVGPAWYSAPTEVWRELLPWLLWGEVAQVGKDTAKGNGVYRIMEVR